MLHSPPGYDDAMMAGNSEEPSRGQHANEVVRDAEKATPDSKVERRLFAASCCVDSRRAAVVFVDDPHADWALCCCDNFRCAASEDSGSIPIFGTMSKFPRQPGQAWLTSMFA